MQIFKPLRPVGLNFFETANLRVTTHFEANCSRERLMETLRGDTVWTQWAPALKKVEWTCARPFGQGATRTVHLAGGQAVKENFFHWEEGKHIAFYVVEATIDGIESFAENYLIEACADGKKTRLTWTVAIQVTGVGALFIPVSRFFMTFFFKRWMNNYKQLLERG